MTAVVEGDFVVFLIGPRINRWWKFGTLWSFGKTMPAMLQEIYANPEIGFLGAESFGLFRSVSVQYWRSWEHIERFARSKESTHFPAWRWFNQAIGSNGDVGIWHETFLVKEGQYEAVYNNMPIHGLGKVGELVPAAGKYKSGAARLNREEQLEAPQDYE